MGRNFSPFITNFFASRAAADARVYNTETALEIVLRGGGYLRVAGKDLTLSSVSKGGASITLTPSLFFAGKIEQIPEIFLSQDATADGSGIFNLVNLDYLLSALIPEPTRLLDKAEVTAFLCFPKPDGTYEGVIEDKGFLRLSEGDDETSELSYVSDISDRTVTAGGKEITQRCSNVFAVIDPELRSFCGAANDPTVNPLTDICSLDFDDETQGCAHWGQQATFQGVSFFNPLGPAGYGGPLGGGGGWDPTDGTGRGGCHDEAGWFLCGDGEWRGGENIKKGVTLLDHHGRIGMVEQVERFWADYRYLLTTSSGTQSIITPTHPLIVAMDDERGTAAMNCFDTIDLNRRVVDYGQRGQMSRFSLRPAEPGWCLRIAMTKPNIYIAGVRAGRGTAGHNEKPIYQIELGG